jgi:hypothetical protein
MADLLLQTHKTPGLHVTEAKLPSRVEPKADKLTKPSQDSTTRTLRKAVSRSLRDANNAFLSWRHGQTAEERERIRLREEKKDLLSSHMKTVRGLACAIAFIILY